MQIAVCRYGMKLVAVLVASFLFLVPRGLLAREEVFRTRIFDPKIKTLRAVLSGDTYTSDLLELNGKDVIELSFDELSHDNRFYTYRVIHCNADWTRSNISEMEYLNGFTTLQINDSRISNATAIPYTHYKLEIPNRDMQFRISGNYVLQIFEDKPETPVAQFCFSVVEPKVDVVATIRGNTDVELNRRLQQLDFHINLSGYNILDANRDLKVTVRQNRRSDNEVTDIKPTFIAASKLSYINNPKLIFEGGNEYRRFDISSLYTVGIGVDKIAYDRPYYDAFLYPDLLRNGSFYSFEPDVNGRSVINTQEGFRDSDTGSDYVRVFFTLEAEPFFDGDVYIGGDLNYNLIGAESRMQYDFENKKYFYHSLLKQGGYNYQYWFVSKNTGKVSVERVEGSHWQTGNEYAIYVYYRPWGERYDRLIGVKTVSKQ